MNQFKNDFKEVLDQEIELKNKLIKNLEIEFEKNLSCSQLICRKSSDQIELFKISNIFSDRQYLEKITSLDKNFNHIYENMKLIFNDTQSDIEYYELDIENKIIQFKFNQEYIIDLTKSSDFMNQNNQIFKSLKIQNFKKLFFNKTQLYSNIPQIDLFQSLQIGYSINLEGSTGKQQILNLILNSFITNSENNPSERQTVITFARNNNRQNQQLKDLKSNIRQIHLDQDTEQIDLNNFQIYLVNFVNDLVQENLGFKNNICLQIDNIDELIETSNKRNSKTQQTTFLNLINSIYLLKGDSKDQSLTIINNHDKSKYESKLYNRDLQINQLVNQDVTIDLDGTNVSRIIKNNQFNFPFIPMKPLHLTTILMENSTFIIKHLKLVVSNQLNQVEQQKIEYSMRNELGIHIDNFEQQDMFDSKIAARFLMYNFNDQKIFNQSNSTLPKQGKMILKITFFSYLKENELIQNVKDPDFIINELMSQVDKNQEMIFEKIEKLNNPKNQKLSQIFRSDINKFREMKSKFESLQNFQEDQYKTDIQKTDELLKDLDKIQDSFIITLKNRNLIDNESIDQVFEGAKRSNQVQNQVL